MLEIFVRLLTHQFFFCLKNPNCLTPIMHICFKPRVQFRSVFLRMLAHKFCVRPKLCFFFTDQSLYKSETKAMKNHLKCITHYTRNCKDFSKKIVVKIVAYIKNSWKNHCYCEKKVVVCMEDNCIFCSFVCSVGGPF